MTLEEIGAYVGHARSVFDRLRESAAETASSARVIL